MPNTRKQVMEMGLKAKGQSWEKFEFPTHKMWNIFKTQHFWSLKYVHFSMKTGRGPLWFDMIVCLSLPLSSTSRS